MRFILHTLLLISTSLRMRHKFFIALHYQHDAIYEKDTRLQMITYGCRKSGGLLFYDECNFVAIIGSKSRRRRTTLERRMLV